MVANVGSQYNASEDVGTKGENGITGVLGTSWKHMEDTITFEVSLNFSQWFSVVSFVFESNPKKFSKNGSIDPPKVCTNVQVSSTSCS